MADDADVYVIDDEMEEKNSESKVLSAIKCIHKSRKRADSDTIITKTKDVSPEKIKGILKKLCNEKILSTRQNRSGLESYRFIDENNDTEKEEQEKSFDFEIEEDGMIKQINEVKDSANNSFQTEVDESKKFEIFQQFVIFTQKFERFSCDIKEFIAYEVNKLRNSFSGELVNQLRDENKFLRQEIQESRKLIKDVLEMSSLHQTQTQSSETNRKSETNRNTENWKYVANGPSRRSTESLKSNSITVSNRYNNLYVEENLNNPQDNFSNDADNDENFNVISKHERECKKKLAESATSYKRPNPVVNPHPEREFYLKKKSQAENNVSRKKNIRIISDSIPKRISTYRFNQGINNGFCCLKCFPGANVANLNYYANPTLEEENPDIVIIHVGINNLLSSELRNTSDNALADEIIEIGRK